MDLAGIKLLAEARTMPCFGFLIKTVTMTHCYWALLAQSHGHFSSLHSLHCAAPGSTADPNWPKGHSIPHGTVLSSKSWREGRERGDVWSNGICLTKKPLHVKPCFPGGGWTPPACQWEVANEFLLHCLCWAFMLPNSFSSSPSRSSPTPWGMAAAKAVQDKAP